MSKVFEVVTGRKHASFPNFKTNVIGKLKEVKLKDWIFNRFFNDVASYQFY